MVRGVNKVILLGNTAAEPDFRVLTNGNNTAIASVGLATNDSYRDQNGNVQETTEWHRLVFWGRTAEIARDYMRKGSLIYVEGKIKSRTYEDQQGVKRYVTEVHVTELHLLSQKSGNGAEPAAAPHGYLQQPDNGGYQQQAPAPYGYQAQAPAQPQGGYQQAPAYQQQPAPAAPQAYAQQGYQPAPAQQPPAYQQGGYRQQGSFRNAPPAGAVPVGPAPAAQPAQAPAAAPATFQTATPAAPQAQDGNRPFKDDDLPF